MKGNGWYDIFLINTSGRIVYTVARESDLGMVIPSELPDSGIEKAFRDAKRMGLDDIALSDIAPYAPSADAPAAFMMASIVDSNGKHAGYVAFQIPLDKINEIMLRRDGMGETGESYLVGRDGLMRSDSYLDPKGHSVIASFRDNLGVDTEATREAFSGGHGSDVIIDYNGNPVLSVWDTLDLGNGVLWAMMTEIDVGLRPSLPLI